MKFRTAFLITSIVLTNAAQPFEADFTPIANAGNYSTFLDSVIKTGTDEVISANAPSVTIFGPSDFAFSVISDQVDSLSDQELIDILLGHVVVNSTITDDLLAKEGCIVATTVQGRNLSIYKDPLTGAVDVDGVEVLESILGDFGIFHAVQSVLLPGAIDFLDCPAMPDFSQIADAGQYKTFLSAMIDSNQDFLVAVNSPVTIFGPNDSAFDTLLANTDVSEIVSDHIAIFRNISLEDIMIQTCIDSETVGGARVAIRYDNSTDAVSVNGIPVENFILGEYGSFLGIDGVLVESDSAYKPCTDFSPIVETGKYGILLDAIAETKTDAFIGDFAPVTIFGPTDDAFSDFQATTEGVIDEDLIQQHVILVEAISFEFISQVECYERVTTGGMAIDIRHDKATNATTVNGIPIVDVEIVGNFGVLHGISGVLIPGVTVYTPCADFSPIVEANDYGIFLETIERTRTNELISEYSPVTVFAPTDSAFASVEEILAEMSDSQLAENVLFHHLLIYKEIFSSEVIASGCVEAGSFGGSMVAIRHDSSTGSFSVNGIPIVKEDIIANFGVVHGIDGILNGTAVGQFTPCPTTAPSGSEMPAVLVAPSASPSITQPTTSKPDSIVTSGASASYAFASFAAVIAMLVL